VKNQTSGFRIGITIGLHREDESLWNNGIKQNAVFLAEALKGSQLVRSVLLVNTTGVPITPALPWDQLRWPTVQFDDAKDSLDLLIELGGQISPEQTDYIKRQETRLVSYCCGFEYVHAMESIIFGRPLWGHKLFVNQRYDDLWVIPQVASNSLHYFSTLRRKAATVVPFIWHPMFIEGRSVDFPEGGRYRPHPGPRRLSVMEQNLDVVKFCLYPILIAEEAYRRHPELITYLHVTNTMHLANDSKEFVALMNQLDIVRNQKASFLGVYETPGFLSEMTDIVVSHQWDNPLNYFYLEVCWQGFPLVHNAHLCADLGYYYEGNDVQQGCEQLVKALTNHDSIAPAYLARQRQAISRYLPTDPEVVRSYETLLARVMVSPIV